MAVTFSCKTAVRFTTCGLVFEEVSPPAGMEQWREFFIAVKPCPGDELQTKALFDEKNGLPDLVAVAVELTINHHTIEEMEDVLRTFYEEYGPIFKEALPLYELRKRLALFLLAGLLWDDAFPATGPELMEQRGQITALLTGLETTGGDLVELIPGTLVNLISGQPPVFTKAMGPLKVHGFEPLFWAGILFSNPPALDAPLAEKVAWLQKTVSAFVTKILNKHVAIRFSTNQHGNVSITATPTNIYAAALLAALTENNQAILHACPGCGMPTSRSNYCSPNCQRKYSPGFAKQRVLAVFRSRKNKGKVTPEEYEAIKKKAGRLGAMDEGLLKEELEDYLIEMRKPKKRRKA